MILDRDQIQESRHLERHMMIHFQRYRHCQRETYILYATYKQGSEPVALQRWHLQVWIDPWALCAPMLVEVEPASIFTMTSMASSPLRTTAISGDPGDPLQECFLALSRPTSCADRKPVMSCAAFLGCSNVTE